MNLTRQRPTGRSGRSIFGLVSVLALLALACFVPMAQALDSSGIEYRDAPPTATGQIPTKPDKTATGSRADNGGARTPESTSDTSNGGSGEEHSETGGVAGNGNQNNGGGSGRNDASQGQGNPGTASGPGKGTLAPATPNTADNGGSSPLVPILIGVAVLMAAAIAAVVIRQRRQRDGGDADPRVSPEAS